VFKILLKPVDGGEPVEVEVERAGGAARETHVGRIGANGVEFELEQFASGDGWLRIHERVTAFHAVRDGERIRVWAGGRSFTVDAVPRGPRRAGAASAARSTAVTAPMPGAVLKVHVSAGDAFDAHQPLVIMESMKMEMTLSVPHAGRVKDVLCRPGQLVELGAALVKLEDAG
jgi:biotin carboxyl carrier protein